MRNLLPERNRKMVRREYYTRLAAVSLGMLAIAMGIGSISLLPAYFVTESKRASIEKQAKLVEQSLALRDETASAEEVRRANTRLRLLEDSDMQIALSAIVRSLIRDKPAGIALAGINISRSDEGSTIRLEGVAGSRDALLTFKAVLESQKQFVSVELPISNLAQTKDIAFTMNVHGTF